MENRGPDHQEHRRVATGAVNVDLLHARLSIIDLDPRSNQPLTIGPATVVFNGEIYNYLELRAELKRRGVSFTTHSDTEVLVQAYLVWGEKCVEKFEGMWAFAIWDQQKQRLFLSRDRFAEKPLYYKSARGGFYFGSEVKFLRSLLDRPLAVNQRQILRYLVHGYRSLYQHGETFFEEVQEVPYASNMIIDSSGKQRTYRYWEPAYRPQQMTIAEAIERTRAALLRSIKLRLRADVPLAFCLSGGVDSGSLISLAAKELNQEVAAFSMVVSDARYNEQNNVMATARDVGCEHTLIQLKPGADVLDRLQALVAYHDAPVATITFFVHEYLMEAMAERGYKVSVSGTSGDELFSGYYDHWLLHLLEMRNHPDFAQRLKEWQQYIQPLVRNPYLKEPRLFFDNLEERRYLFLDRDVFAQYLRQDFTEEFSEHHFTASPLRNRMLNELFHEATRVVLHEDDLNAMKYSIENRSPYLDTRLFELAYSIPPEHLLKNGFGKYVLREAMRGILNDQVRLSRQKFGFNAPFADLIDVNNASDWDYLMSDGPIFELVDKSKIAVALRESTMPESMSKFLFNFVNAKLFLELQAGKAQSVADGQRDMIRSRT
ncbi:MAG: asparagine synthase (glutamine-hydrolyzing) [Parcubacteria group bacterium RIFCSPHIGHO2_01_FULL_56_18]|nr:MAG: asparagine synthase (glutamine-hydrolyzing) [Parcubacteria group bacterium RIFCSPHIGHO2_01_FULL_56_18]